MNEHHFNIHTFLNLKNIETLKLFLVTERPSTYGHSGLEFQDDDGGGGEGDDDDDDDDFYIIGAVHLSVRPSQK